MVPAPDDKEHGSSASRGTGSEGGRILNLRQKEGEEFEREDNLQGKYLHTFAFSSN